MKTIAGITSILVCLMLLTSCTQSINGNQERPYIKTEGSITYYKGAPYSGEIIFWNDYGQPNSKKNYKEGKRDGLYEKFNNGQLWYKANYKDNKKDGLEELYFKNGQVRERINYKDGKEDGLCEYYFENGQLDHTTSYKDGTPIETTKYKDGKVIKITPYR